MNEELPGGSVKERLTRIETMLIDMRAEKTDQEARLRSLEKHRWTEHGVVLALSFLLSHAKTIASKIFSP